MSTTIERPARTAFETAEANPLACEVIKRGGDETRSGFGSIRIEALPSASLNSKQKATGERVIRRLRGFVVAFEGETSRVMFVERDQRFIYKVPTKRLFDAGIEVENQPFEMDEMEVVTSGGDKLLGTTFRASAKATDAQIEPLGFSSDYQRKRNEVLKYFKNASP
jgi:hypothetical protein